MLGPNIKYFGEHGVRGIFEEGSYATSGGDMDALKDYVMGRMLWNATLDPDTLIQEFLTGYFGKAAPFVKKCASRALCQTHRRTFLSSGRDTEKAELVAAPASA